MIRPLLLFIFSMLFSLTFVFAQTDSLRYRIGQVISKSKAFAGISIYGLENKDTVNINACNHYPMQSVFKFHIALTVLNEVDKGKLSLQQKVYLKKSDLLPGTWSPLRDKYPNANVYVSLAEVLEFTVSQSDNNGCDILLRLIGGTKTVDDYLNRIGCKDVSIQVNEAGMHENWNAQFKNWTTPSAANQLLAMFYGRKILSGSSYEFLWKAMLATSVSKNRIKGELPAGTLVAHRSGTSDINTQGITAAINDIGIVTLPDGNHFAISVFVSNSKENTDTNEKIIADIARLAYNYFINTNRNN